MNNVKAFGVSLIKFPGLLVIDALLYKAGEIFEKVYT